MTGKVDPMTGSHVVTSGRAQVRDLAWDMATARGALGEIATCWRRSAAGERGLPLLLPIRLQDSAGQIEADIRSLADAEPGHAADLVIEVAWRFEQFQRDIAAARAMSREPRAGDTGDSALWESVDDAVHRAGCHLLSLITILAPVADWTLGTPGEDSGKVVLRVTLADAHWTAPPARAMGPAIRGLPGARR